jgi:hypothetical protein
MLFVLKIQYMTFVPTKCTGTKLGDCKGVQYRYTVMSGMENLLWLTTGGVSGELGMVMAGRIPIFPSLRKGN